MGLFAEAFQLAVVVTHRPARARGLDADRLDRRIDAVLALQPVRGDVDELFLPNSFAFYWVTLCPPMRCTA